MFRTLIVCVAVLLAALTGSAQAQGTKVGNLDCDVAAGVGLIIASQRNVSCTFTPAGPGRIEYYTGTMSNLGIDIGVTAGAKLGWLVFAATSWREGALAGKYVGGQANASIFAGLGANALVGGFGNSFARQPLSGQVQVGLNIAAGAAALDLTFAGAR